jgi:hypothetical protein
VVWELALNLLLSIYFPSSLAVWKICTFLEI